VGLSSSGVRKSRKILGTVGVQAVFRRTAANLQDVLVLTVLELDLALRQQPREIGEQLPGHDDGAVTRNRGFERRPQ
jgi:hypothetical protein